MHTLILSSLVCIASLLSGVSAVVAADENEFKPQYRIYTTAQADDKQPSLEEVSEFSCNDRVYIVIESEHITADDHNLVVKWRNPLGDVQELTRYDFTGSFYTRIWVWLQLHGPTGAIIGQAFDPSFGMEEFIGEWRAQIQIDKRNIGEVRFNVLC